MRILVTGASGKLGEYLARAAARRGLDVALTSRREPLCRSGLPWHPADLEDPQSLPALLERVRPEVVLHSAALSAVADCHARPERADRFNHQLVHSLRGSGRLIYISTDMVFDGEQAPYGESSEPRPLSQYGHSKRRGELAALEEADALVVRLPLMVGPALGRELSFYDQTVEHFRAGRKVSFFADEWRSLLGYDQVAETLFDLLQSRARGLVHLGGARRSRLDLGQALAARLGCPSLVLSGKRADHPAPEPRARDLTLTLERIARWLPDWSATPVEEQLESWLGAPR